jgi:hypothetical protein
MSASPVILISPRDNVAVALRNIAKGETVSLPDGRTITISNDIPFSHKVALEDLPAGATVLKYGESIGEARETIHRGDWVHTHNLDIEDRRKP